jgi:hypothetical protein
MEISVDADVKTVLEFMERNVAADKLLRVAAAVGALAPILWSELTPLQRSPVLSLSPECSHEQRLIATQSRLAEPCAGDDSVVAADSQSRK